MRLLALDTSSVACSVALQVGTNVSARHDERPREHTALLVPMIDSLLSEGGIVASDLDAIVLGNGPGSFIGMRIAASVAQGLAFGSGLRIVPVSSLAAVAAQVFREYQASEAVVVQDAHMHEVYLGVYRCNDEREPVEVTPERLQGIEAIAELADKPDGARLGAGFGWQRYPDLLAANRHGFDTVVDVLHPHAAFLLPLGASVLTAGGGIDPQHVSPAYLRQKVAAKPANAP